MGMPGERADLSDSPVRPGRSPGGGKPRAIAALHPRASRGSIRRVKRVFSFGLTLAFAVGMSSPALAATHVVDRARAHGDFAVATASGSVDEPRRLWVKVYARPNQGVHVAWNVVCSRGSGAGSRDGAFNATTPVKRPVRMNYRRPDSCTFSAAAQLDDSGSITVILLARVPG